MIVLHCQFVFFGLTDSSQEKDGLFSGSLLDFGGLSFVFVSPVFGRL